MKIINKIFLLNVCLAINANLFAIPKTGLKGKKSARFSKKAKTAEYPDYIVTAQHILPVYIDYVPKRSVARVIDPALDYTVEAAIFLGDYSKDELEEKLKSYNMSAIEDLAYYQSQRNAAEQARRSALLDLMPGLVFTPGL